MRLRERKSVIEKKTFFEEGWFGVRLVRVAGKKEEFALGCCDWLQYKSHKRQFVDSSSPFYKQQLSQLRILPTAVGRRVRDIREILLGLARIKTIKWLRIHAKRAQPQPKGRGE